MCELRADDDGNNDDDDANDDEDVVQMGAADRKRAAAPREASEMPQKCARFDPLTSQRTVLVGGKRRSTAR